MTLSFPSGDQPFGNPYNSPSGQGSGPQKSPGDGKAIAALVLGLCSIPLACCPLLGLAVGVPGIILGVMGKNSNKSGMAMAGLVLSVIGLLLALANGIWGAYLATTGQHPLFPPQQ